MKKVLTLVFLFLTLSSASAQTNQMLLPIPEQLFLKLSLSVQRLIEALGDFGTMNQNKFLISDRVLRTTQYLTQVKAQLANRTNVIRGKGNTINGDDNIVMGNFNQVDGSNNWVFVSKFSGQAHGSLLLSEWMIDLEKAKFIQSEPWIAISYIDEIKNREIRYKYFINSRAAVKWAEWAQPNNPFWRSWEGYQAYIDEYFGAKRQISANAAVQAFEAANTKNWNNLQSRFQNRQSLTGLSNNFAGMTGLLATTLKGVFGN